LLLSGGVPDAQMPPGPERVDIVGGADRRGRL
jgi:hypothetical protein